MQMQQIALPLPGTGGNGTHIKLHLGTGALPRRKHLHTPVGVSRHENAVQTARELVSHALDGPPCAGIGAGALPLSNREGARPMLGKLGGKPPSTRMGSRNAPRLIVSRGASRAAPSQLGSAGGIGAPMASPRLHQRLDLPQTNSWHTPSFGKKKAIPIRQPAPPSATRTTAPAPNRRRGVTTGRMMQRGGQKMTPIAVTPIFHGMEIGPPSGNSQPKQGPQTLAQATPSLMATLEARFNLVTTPRSPAEHYNELPMTPIEQLLQREPENSARGPDAPLHQPAKASESSRLEPEPEPEPEPQPQPQLRAVPNPPKVAVAGNSTDKRDQRPALIRMPLQLQTQQTGSSQRPWLLKLAGEGPSDGLLDSFVTVVHFAIMVEIGACGADEAESDDDDNSDGDNLMNTSGSFFGTIRLPTDLAAEMSKMETEEGEHVPGLSDTPKRVQANRQLERVLGAPRIAKRLTLSAISPSSVEVVRGATPGEISSSRDKDGVEEMEKKQLPLMEATVNCAPFETYVNGAATPSANALAEQGGRLVAKATLHFREECQLQPLVIKVDLPWEVSGMVITDKTVSFEEWDGWEDVHLEAVKRRQARCGRKSSIDEGRQRWQAQERERRQSELSEELVDESSDDHSDSDDTESGEDTVEDEIMRLSTVAEQKTMELTNGHSSGMSGMHATSASGESTSSGSAFTKEMRSGALTRDLTRANSVALSSGGFSLTSRSSDSESGGSVRGTGMPGGTVTSPLAFTQEGVEASEPALASTGRSSACSTGSVSSGSSGSRSSTAGSGSLEVWMGLPKSPRLGADGGVAEGHRGAAILAAVAVLSPAQESEEVDSAVRNPIADTRYDENDSDYDAENETDDWSDLEEDDYVGNAGGVHSQSIQSTMSKFDQLEASWRLQLRSSGFHG